VFSNSPESMDISKDGLEIVVVSMHYDDNNTPDSTLTFESRSPVAGCTPNCSCAAGTCAGLTCWDQCGGTCEGNLTPDCSGRECGMSPNGCGSCDDPGCPFHMRCSDGQCVLWECMPYIMVIIALIAVIAAVTFIAIKRKPYSTPSSIGGVSLT
jgi:hypothetical protein